MACGRHVKNIEVYRAQSQYPSRALISRHAFEHNLAVAQRYAGDAELMAVVKADAYGHGAEEIAEWAIESGVRWLAIAQLGEAITVRRKIGDDPHILALIAEPEELYPEALELGIDLTVGCQRVLDEVARAGAKSGMAARVHLEVDTGMSRGGVTLPLLEELADSLADYQDAGLIDVVGMWSHLACADDLDSPVTAEQVERFEEARRILADHGIEPKYLHLAASAGLLWHPQTRYTMVRPGIMLYGLSPNPQVATAKELGLLPVMTLEAHLSSVRDVPAGTGISYGHTAHTETDTRLATVPLGYGDGISRSASNQASVLIGDELCPIRGRVCMDQFVVEAPHAHLGDSAVLFGAPDGALTADEWADCTGTIGYEIVTRLGVRVPREYVD